ncbi:unnamed protein product [Rotaria magnacalcarata]|uniref:Ionotropic glutamate receptor C-terminal domain-containing protein n=1 Tax=Rotaria magnacalcarata TaxID=392030 RepID=A0A815C429_9BILA|nr:unnamed protein product [Rotaria magnacalcarata]CAF1507075.1 unnamed protein product [Rotaria magnacalcarata]
MPDLIKLLENRIGFISDIQIVPSNGRYSDLIQAIENDTYDIVIGDVTVTATRRQSVDFSNAIFDNCLRIVMRQTPDIHVDLLSFLNTFSINLWLLVLGTFIYAGLYILCLILIATFTANLTSDLTITKSKADTGTAEYSTNNIYCNLTLIGDDFDKGAFGIVTPKEWIYAKDLDVNILLLRESGELEELREEWFQVKNCPPSYETSTSKHVDSMLGLFLVFAIITFLALLLFIWSNRPSYKNYLYKVLDKKKSLYQIRIPFIKRSKVS